MSNNHSGTVERYPFPARAIPTCPPYIYRLARQSRTSVTTMISNIAPTSRHTPFPAANGIIGL
jgi:hypothetical protein